MLDAAGLLVESSSALGEEFESVSLAEPVVQVEEVVGVTGLLAGVARPMEAVGRKDEFTLGRILVKWAVSSVGAVGLLGQRYPAGLDQGMEVRLFACLGYRRWGWARHG